MGMVKLAIIIPCFNESGNIQKVIEELNNISISGVEIHPLVVNDCSSDNTIDIVRTLACDYLDLPVNLGIGGAVQSGFKYAWKNNFDIAIQLDGDGQHPADQIEDIIKPIIENKADVVIGSRFINKKGFQSTFARRMGIQYFMYLNRLLIGLKIHDSTSGFRAINRKALNIVSDYYPDEYPEPEAILLYAMNDLKIMEVPVLMKAREEGVSSIRSFGSLYYMFKVTLGIVFMYLKLLRYGKRNSF